jgi:voltage-gated potassium channel
MYLYRHRHLRYSSLLLLSYFVVGIAFASHWITCGWLAINGINPDASRITNYINSFYWSVTTLTTVGYGDIIPKNNAQKLYAVLTMILGISFFGYLIGNIASILSKKDPADMHFLENIEKLSISVKYRSIPPDLQKRIYDYYTYIWKKRLGYDESSFLNSLPKSLKTEVSLHLRREVIKKIPLFKDAEQEFIKEIALQLKPVILTPGDYVFNAGDEGKEMYFVVHGELDVFLKDEKKPLARLSDGDFFGEIALFMKKPRTATIKAVTYCDLYTLGKNTFNHLVSKYPDIAAEIEKKAKTREEKNVMLWER